MKLVVDTNIFISFYETPPHTSEILSQLSDLAERLVIPYQVELEFMRLYRKNIRKAADVIRKGSLHLSLPKTLLLEQWPELTKEARAALQTLKECQKKLVSNIQSLADGEELDPIALAFSKLRAKATLLETADAVIQSAQKRRLTGAPPSSPERHSIGDEIIFETLIANPDDYALVTADTGFLDYKEVLASEYVERTGKSLSITRELEQGLKLLDVEASEATRDYDKSQKEALKKATRIFRLANVPPGLRLPTVSGSFPTTTTVAGT